MSQITLRDGVPRWALEELTHEQLVQVHKDVSAEVYRRALLQAEAEERRKRERDIRNGSNRFGGDW